MTDLVHKNGVNIIAQISVMKDLELPVEDIDRITDVFADAAEKCVKAGFKGIEIGVNHHDTLSQFLSPKFNHRIDEYGGSDENRARFIKEIIKKIRARRGKEYILILKINSEDNDQKVINNDLQENDDHRKKINFF